MLQDCRLDHTFQLAVTVAQHADLTFNDDGIIYEDVPDLGLRLGDVLLYAEPYEDDVIDVRTNGNSGTPPTAQGRAERPQGVDASKVPLLNDNSMDALDPRETMLKQAGESKVLLTMWHPELPPDFPDMVAAIREGTCDALCIAFVSFFEPASADKASLAGCVEGYSGTSIRPAPPAGTVDWNNIQIFPHITTLRLILAVCALGIGTNWVVAPTMLSFISWWIRRLSENIVENDDAVAAIVQMVPFFFLYCVNSVVVPTMIAHCARLSRPWQKDFQLRVRFMMNYFFLILLLFGLPLLNLGTVWQLVQTLASLGGAESHGHVRLHFGRCTEFSLQYLISSTFIGALTELFQFSQAMWMFVFADPSKWDFSFGFSFAFHLSICTLALTFSAINSALIPIAAVYFFSRYWVDKYLFAYDVRKFENTTDGWTEELILRMFLFQVTISLGIISFAFPDPNLALSLRVLSAVIACVSFWPSLFRVLPKPTRREDSLFRIPNMGKFLQALSVAYKIPVGFPSSFVRVAHGYSDKNCPWYISVIANMEV